MISLVNSPIELLNNRINIKNIISTKLHRKKINRLFNKINFKMYCFFRRKTGVLPHEASGQDSINILGKDLFLPVEISNFVRKSFAPHNYGERCS